MYQFIVDNMKHIGFENFNSFIAYIILTITGLLTCFILRTIIRSVIGRFLKRAMTLTESAFITALIDSKLVKRASNIVIPIVLFLTAYDLAERYAFLRMAAEISLVIVVMFIVFSCLKIIEVVYGACEAAKNFPLHGILQVITVAVSIIGGIIVVSVLMGTNPAVLLGSIGAMTAIVTLIFKDAILGFVAGIQLTTNDMIHIGDWIEVPAHSANGFVIDITMTTVKVENFDKTITSIPAYTLVSESFINWRGMLDTGGRRIKRPIFIDATMVCICDEEMLKKYKSIAILKDIIEEKEALLKKYNDELGSDLSIKANGRRLTNLGVFREYIIAYLRQHPNIRQDLALLARQLDPSDKGIPMEIIAFAAATAAVDYEAIQADIFDHLYAIISEFDLRLYQNPSSNDIAKLQLSAKHFQS